MTSRRKTNNGNSYTKCQGRNGDSLELKDQLDYDVVITDPPYGINHPTDYTKLTRNEVDRSNRLAGDVIKCTNYPPVIGDDKPFDPALWIDRPCCLFGANYFADKLPPTSGWLVWDKHRPDALNQARAEMAWTNFVKGVRVFEFLWNGCQRDSREPLVHPTQKPTKLMEWILQLRWMPEGIILDPYMGSGSTLVAARNLGREAIGIELSAEYCEVAKKRLIHEPRDPRQKSLGTKRVMGNVFDM